MRFVAVGGPLVVGGSCVARVPCVVTAPAVDPESVSGVAGAPWRENWGSAKASGCNSGGYHLVSDASHQPGPSQISLMSDTLPKDLAMHRHGGTGALTTLNGVRPLSNASLWGRSATRPDPPRSGVGRLGTCVGTWSWRCGPLTRDPTWTGEDPGHDHASVRTALDAHGAILPSSNTAEVKDLDKLLQVEEAEEECGRNVGQTGDEVAAQQRRSALRPGTIGQWR